jgi:hypothetical protein
MPRCSIALDRPWNNPSNTEVAKGLLLQLGPALLAWAAVLFKLPAVCHSPGNPELRAYWSGLLGVALTLTVLLPPVYVAIDRLAGVPNLARLLGHSLALTGGWSVQAFLLLLNYPPATARRKIRRRSWALAGTLVLMAILFTRAVVDDETTEFMRRYARAPLLVEYWVLFLAYLGMVGGNVVHLTWRYAQLSDRVALRLGLRLTTVGGLFGLGYVAHEAVYLAARGLRLDYPLGDNETVTQVLVAGATAFIVVGSTMPAWGPRVRLPALWRWADQYRAYRRLYPLWCALCQSSPKISLVPPSSLLVDTMAISDLDFRLYRRVIEIRDGRLALRPYLDPRVAEVASTRGREAGLSDEELPVLVEATSLAAALRAKAQDRPASGVLAFEGFGGTDLEGEVAWLTRVAHSYARSPLVRTILEELACEECVDTASRVSSGPAMNVKNDDWKSAAVRRGAARQRMARLVTNVLAPVPIAAALPLVVAWESTSTTAEAVAWGLVAVLFASLLPFLFVLRQVRRGRLTDQHVRLRGQRTLPLLVGMASVLVGLGLLMAYGAPRELVALVGAMMAGLVVSLLVTLWWKISLHTGVAAGAVVILVLVFGPTLLAFAPAVGLIGWARVEVGDHTPAQAAVGAGVGAIVAAAAFSLLR